MSNEATATQAKSTPRKRGTSTRTKANQEAAVKDDVLTDETAPQGVVAVIESVESDTTDDDEVLEGELITTDGPKSSGLRVMLGANDHKSTMFTERTAPWMKLGQLVDGVRSAQEAAELGGIDFDVQQVPTAYLWNDAWVEISNRKTIVRKDNGMPMSIVSEDYNVLQYGEAFNFMDQINAEYVAAGALKNGKQGFMVVKIPDHFEHAVLGDDKHEFFVVLRTSHDLTKALEVMVMPLRGLCMNQLTLRSFTKGVENRWAIRHTSTMHEKLQEAQRSVMKLGDYTKEFTRIAERLVSIKVNEVTARQFMREMFPDRPRTAEKINRIINMWHSSTTVAFPGTGWGLVNAVGEYYDWERTGGSQESRFTAALQGQTHAAINKMTSRVLSLA